MHKKFTAWLTWKRKLVFWWIPRHIFWTFKQAKNMASDIWPCHRLWLCHHRSLFSEYERGARVTVDQNRYRQKIIPLHNAHPFCLKLALAETEVSARCPIRHTVRQIWRASPAAKWLNLLSQFSRSHISRWTYLPGVRAKGCIDTLFSTTLYMGSNTAQNIRNV
jgi:hypothetical protein